MTRNPHTLATPTAVLKMAVLTASGLALTVLGATAIQEHGGGYLWIAALWLGGALTTLPGIALAVFLREWAQFISSKQEGARFID